MLCNQVIIYYTYNTIVCIYNTYQSILRAVWVSSVRSLPLDARREYLCTLAKNMYGARAGKNSLANIKVKRWGKKILRLPSVSYWSERHVSVLFYFYFSAVFFCTTKTASTSRKNNWILFAVTTTYLRKTN